MGEAQNSISNSSTRRINGNSRSSLLARVSPEGLQPPHWRNWGIRSSVSAYRIVRGELTASLPRGGINAAKNYQNDGDSVWRLFYDTVKGGDFRSREANVHRLAEVSVNIIDQCVAQGVPFARDYGGLLD